MMLQQEQKFGKKMLTSILFVSIGAYTTFSHDRDKLLSEFAHCHHHYHCHSSPHSRLE